MKFIFKYFLFNSCYNETKYTYNIDSVSVIPIDDLSNICLKGIGYPKSSNFPIMLYYA